MKKIIGTIFLLVGCVQFESGSSITGIERFTPELCLNLREHFYVVSRRILTDLEKECQMDDASIKNEDQLLKDQEDIPTKCDSEENSYIAMHDYNCILESNTLNDMHKCTWTLALLGPSTINKMDVYRANLIGTYCRK